MIVTGGEGEKVDLKICLARELNPGFQARALTTITRSVVKDLEKYFITNIM